MKKKNILLSFAFIALVGIIGIGLGTYKGETIGMTKKEVKVATESAPVPDDGYGKFGQVGFYNAIDKRGEDGDFLSNVRFKMSTYNGIVSANSYQSGDYYYVEERYDGEDVYEDAYEVLSDLQRTVVESVHLTSDFTKFNNGNYIYCESYQEYWNEPVQAQRKASVEGSDAEFRRQSGYYCYITLPTIYYLEETRVPTDYVKDKIILPGNITLTYYVSGYVLPSYEELQRSTAFYRLTDIFGNNSYPVELVEVQVRNVNNSYYLEYGDVDIEDLVGIDVEQAWQLWENNAIVGNECSYVETVTEVYSNKILNSSLEMMSAVPSEAVLETKSLPCGMIYLVNQKGEVNLEVNSYVNNKEKTTTTINSNLQYRVVVKNTGSVDAIDSVVTSKLPEGFVYVKGSASNGGEYLDGTVQWRVDRVKVGKEVELTYQAYAPNGADTSKMYIGEANAQAFGMKSKVDANKTTVKLNFINPSTIAPIGMIGIMVVTIIGISVLLKKYYQNKSQRQQIHQS